MSGLFGGGKTISSESPRIGSVRINSSAYGMCIPLLWGTTRVSGNLIWYGDFTAIPHTSTTSSGGKGGGAPKMQQTSYTYTCAFAMGLCAGTIGGIDRVWSSKDQTTTSALGLSVFTGTMPQAAWGYLTTTHPTEALGYSNLAYVASGALDLGDSANMPNLSFEVRGPRVIGTLSGTPYLDARPDEVMSDLLTDSLSGSGFPAARIYSLSDYRNYCQASGFFVSPAITEQAPAKDHIKELCQMTNSEAIWSEGKLKIIPYGDSAVTGNGITWTPNVTPLFDLTDDDFLADGGDDVIRVNRKTPADAFNRVQVEYLARNKEYNTDLGEAKDPANIAQFGLRPKDVIQMHWITERAMADQIADLIMRRDLYIRNEYEFNLGWRYAMLEPMDIVTITHAQIGANRVTVRIISIEESAEGELSIVAEEMPWAISTPAKITTQATGGATVDFNIAPGNSNAPVIFEPPIALATRPELWIATSGGANWGGAEVWVSMDNATYSKVGTVTAPARHGTLSASMASGGDPDVSTVVGIDLGVSRGAISGGTLLDRDAYNTLCYVDGELISYQNATLTGSYRYDLSSLRRGAYGSVIGAHALGTKFARLDQSIFKLAYDPAQIGRTMYVKLRSYNVYGTAAQDLGTLSPTTYVIAGAPLGTVGGLAAEQPFVGTSARIKWTAYPGALAYEVEVWSGSLLKRTVSNITATRFEYSFEDAKADGGPYRTLEFRVKAVAENGSSSTSASLTVSNPQIATPGGIAAVSAGSSLSVSADLPADTDFAGMKVWISPTSGFDPSVTVPAYIGPNNFFATPLATGTYYYRLGFYDVFGADGMNLSSEGMVAVAGSAGGIDSVSSLPGSSTIGRVVFLTTDSKLYRYTSTGWSKSADGGDLLASSVTADRMDVANLAAISANMGTITAGSFTLDAFGFIRGGSTGYLTGAGFWMGYHSGAYKFHIGDPTTEYLAWTGSSLTIKGTLNGATGTFAGSLSAATGTFAGSLSAATGTFSGSLSAATGSFAGSLTAAAGTLGALDVAAGGYIKMGQTAFNTGTGFFLGDSGGVAKFSIGNPAGQSMRWDGTSLYVTSATDVQTFSTAGAATWTKPGYGSIAIIECWGGGGGGGGANGNSGNGGGGGGGGSYSRREIALSGLTATVAVTVGAAGGGGAVGVRGNQGGTSSFGTYLSASGGGGGGSCAATPAAGSVATSGSIAGAGGGGGGSGNSTLCNAAANGGMSGGGGASNTATSIAGTGSCNGSPGNATGTGFGGAGGDSVSGGGGGGGGGWFSTTLPGLPGGRGGHGGNGGGGGAGGTGFGNAAAGNASGGASNIAGAGGNSAAAGTAPSGGGGGGNSNNNAGGGTAGAAGAVGRVVVTVR